MAVIAVAVRAATSAGRRRGEHDLVEHAAEPVAVGVEGPAVTVDHAGVRLHAGDDDGGLDELVEGDVVAEPAALGSRPRGSADLPADAGDELAEVARRARGRWRRRRTAPGSRRAERSWIAVCSATMKSTASSRSVIATKRRPTSRSRTLWSPVTPNAANSTEAIISAALEPWACTVSTDTPAAGGDLGQRGAGVAELGEQLRRGGDDAQPGLLRLALAQLRPVRPR